MPVILWDTNVVKEEDKHVQAFRMVGEEIKYPPVLLDVRFWVRFKSMDHVQEFHPITYEEDREIVPDKIKITPSDVKLHCKSSRIPQSFGAAMLMDNSGEPDNNRCLNPRGRRKLAHVK